MVTASGGGAQWLEGYIMSPLLSAVGNLNFDLPEAGQSQVVLEAGFGEWIWLAHAQSLHSGPFAGLKFSPPTCHSEPKQLILCPFCSCIHIIRCVAGLTAHEHARTPLQPYRLMPGIESGIFCMESVCSASELWPFPKISNVENSNKKKIESG